MYITKNSNQLRELPTKYIICCLCQFDHQVDWVLQGAQVIWISNFWLAHEFNNDESIVIWLIYIDLARIYIYIKIIDQP